MTDTPRHPPRRIGFTAAGATPEAGYPAATADESDATVSPRASGNSIVTVERLFFLCILAGFVVAAIGILVGGGEGHLVALVSPLLATLSYPLIGIALGFGRRPAVRERFADNCYYLGFIFTQGGLLLAFLPTTLSNRPITSGEVMQFFGMAIGAALIGLIARTVLTQTGMSLTDVSDTVHHEVETLAARVSEQSRSVVAEFERISAHVAHVPERFGERLDRQMERIDEVFERLLGTLNRTTTELDQSRATIREATSATAEGHARGLSRLVAAMEEAANAVHEVKQEMVARTADGAESIRATAAALTAGMQSLVGLQRLGARVPQIEEEVHRLAESSAAARAAADTASNELRTAVSTTHAGLAEVAREGSAAIIGSSQAAALQLAEAGSQAVARIGQQADGWQGSIEDARAAVSAAVENTQNSLAGIAQENSTVIRDSAGAAARQLAEAGSEAAAKVKQQVSAWQTSLEQATAALAVTADSSRVGLEDAARDGAAAIRDSSQAAARHIAEAGSETTGFVGQQAQIIRTELEQATAALEGVFQRLSERLDALASARGSNG